VSFNAGNFLTFNSSSQIRGHAYKLYKPRCSSIVHQNFSANRIVNIWNSLPATVNFASVASFKQSLKRVDLSCSFEICIVYYVLACELYATVFYTVSQKKSM